MSRKKEKHPYNFPTPKELLLNFGIFPTSIFSCLYSYDHVNSRILCPALFIKQHIPQVCSISEGSLNRFSLFPTKKIGIIFPRRKGKCHRDS